MSELHLAPDVAPAGFVPEWESFPSADGKLKLFSRFQHSEPWTRPVGLLVLHGHGEHGGRYAPYAPLLKQSGGVEAILIPDHRGHGRSEGLRGHAERFDQLVDDAEAAALRLKKRLEDRFGGRAELHLLGHSLGGHIALRLLFRNTIPFASATVTAPFLAVKAKVPVVKKLAANVLEHVWGTLQIPTALDSSGLSRIPEVVEAYQKDRLVHDKMTPRFYGSMQAAWKDTRSRHEGIQVPLQVIVPLADPIVDPEVTQTFYRELKHRDKRLRTFENSLHEPMNDLDREQVFQDIGSWIRSHSGEK